VIEAGAMGWRKYCALAGSSLSLKWGSGNWLRQPLQMA